MERGTISIILSVGILLLGLWICPLQVDGQDKRVVVGGKNFTEQYILAGMAKVLLERNDFDVALQTGVGTAVARRALLNDQIDMYYEYTGTAYTVFYKGADRDMMTDGEAVYKWIKKQDAEKGLIWLDQVKFNNTYTLMMREDQAEKLDIETIGDLARYINENPDKLVIGVNAEFWERPDGFKPLMSHYGFQVLYGKVRKMDSGLVYKALRDGNVDVSMGFATDGRIEAFGFTTLEDDKDYFPVYSPVLVIRKEVIDKYPEIETILKPIADKLTTQQMRQLNAAVDVRHKDVEAVAREWIEKHAPQTSSGNK